MPKYRSAIIGCGGRAYGHANAYQQIPQAELVACANRSDTARCQKFVETFGITGYADAEQMLRTEQPDLVHLVAMPDQWCELIPMVSELGVPACIVEKPIACGVSDWRFLCELEAQTNTKFGVGKQFRWHPGLINCREAVQNGELGDINFLDFSCGMNLAAQGTHIIDWAMSLNNDSPIVRVFGTASGAELLDSDYPAPDTTSCQVLFENRVYGLWNTGWTSPRVTDDPAVHTHCRVTAYSETGYVRFEEFAGWQIVSTERVEKRQTTPDEWRANNDLAQARLTQAMFDWLEDDTRPVETNLKLALHQFNAVLGIYASAISHQPIDLPFEPPDDLDAQLREIVSRS
ncbi:MAG: Gfo/Idh/MocA family oxidoreductase [Candidatus Poribacteria bacterium]|nr:Gfo/Idh/MocA family oxidoreductase [Candidatus Poribacteria bacterium]